MGRPVITTLIVAVACFLPAAKIQAAENIMLAALGDPSSPQIIMAAVGEPGSPVVGKTYSLTNDLHFTVGYRLWLNWWETSVAKATPNIVDPDDDAGCTVKGVPSTNCIIDVRGAPPTIDQFAAASIPSVGVRYKNFFASASVMISPDYNFSTVSELAATSQCTAGPPFCPHVFRIGHRITGSRNEVDANLGYYIHPWVALTMGYKGVFQKFKDKASTFDVTSGFAGASISSTSKPRYNGGTLGVAANIPIPEGGIFPSGMSLYGNGGGGPMGSNDFKYAIYGTIDGGMAYKPTQLPLLFTAGYKFQIVRSITKGNAPVGHINDYTRGAILGLHLIF